MTPRETIHLTPSDWLGITEDGLFKVNRTRYFNPEYYLLIGCNDTQKDIISRLQSTEPNTTQLDHELSQLVTINLLRKKLITHSNNLDRLRYLSGDKKLLKIRSIQKAKKIINRYLTQLRRDVNFHIRRLDKAIISLNYLGQYASTKRVVAF